MKLKDGKELNKLTLIKRLNLMDASYNPKIYDKQYYIDFYNREIQSLLNQNKIQNELGKDRIYADYFNQQLCEKDEYFLNLSSNNNCNNKVKLNENFFSDFDSNYLIGVLLAKFSVDFYDKFKDKIDYRKILFPIKAIKKDSIVNIKQKFESIFIKVVNCIDEKLKEKYDILIFLILVVNIFVILMWSKKSTLKKKQI